MPVQGIQPLVPPVRNPSPSFERDVRNVEQVSGSAISLAQDEAQFDDWVSVRPRAPVSCYSRRLAGLEERNGDAYTRSVIPFGFAKLRSIAPLYLQKVGLKDPVGVSAAQHLSRAGIAVCNGVEPHVQNLGEMVPAAVDSAITLYTSGKQIVENMQERMHWVGYSPAQRLDAELVYDWLTKNGYVHQVSKVMIKKLNLETLEQKDVRNDTPFKRLTIGQLSHLCAGLARKSGQERLLVPRDIADALKGS